MADERAAEQPDGGASETAVSQPHGRNRAQHARVSRDLPGAEDAPREHHAGQWRWQSACAVVADDLTGAMDGGVQLLARTAVEVLVGGERGGGGEAGTAPDPAAEPRRSQSAPAQVARGVPPLPATRNTRNINTPASSVGRHRRVSAHENAASTPDPPARFSQTPLAVDAAAAVLLVINTQSRGLTAAAAAARVNAVCRELLHQGRAVWFKKLDSTLRGNVGAELAALHEALAPCVIVCTPALPTEGRTVQGGVLRVAGEPVMATPYRDEIPARHGAADSSAVIDIVRRQWPQCRAVQMPALAPAGDALQAALRGTPDLIAVDAASDADLIALAAAAGGVTHAGCRLVWAGSAGLLRALALADPVGRRLDPVGRRLDSVGRRLDSAVRVREAAGLPAGQAGVPAAAAAAVSAPVGAGIPGAAASWQARGPIVVVCGSRRALARRQVDNVAAASPCRLAMQITAVPAREVQEPRWRLAGVATAAPAELSGAVAAATAAVALDRRQDLFLCAPAPPQADSSLPDGHAAAIATALAALAASALEVAAQRPLALLLVGGDTAYACLQRLGIGRLALAGEAEPYVPWARVSGGPWDGVAVITKAGGFGDPDTLNRICARLRRDG